MMKKLILFGLAFVLLVFSGNAQAWDVYKAGIPDVDKANVPPGPPGALDMSCWQAAASNLLGGAGYGTGANAQARANSIYGQLTLDLGTANMGCADRAINYWLYTYGKNPDDVNEYRPGNDYTDVTLIDKTGAGGLTPADYDFLLDELVRCQYVAVKLDLPPHCITLVGGDYERNRVPPPDPPPLSQSIWHDSDRDVGNGPDGVNDDVYTNTWGLGTWDLVEYPAWNAQAYVTLCPGLDKPEDAVRNYDVAYFLADTDQDGVWTPMFREAGIKAPDYDDPHWDSLDPDGLTVVIGNESLPEMEKIVYLLVDYFDRVPGRAALEDIRLVDDAGTEWLPTSVIPSADDGQLLFTWALDYQPAWERIVFPDDKYMLLDDDVKDWNLATVCIPEPATVALLGLGALAALRRRRKL